MTDLELIGKIEDIFGFKLKKVGSDEISRKDFLVESYFDSLKLLNSPTYLWKGSRNYCVNHKGNVTGLSLDFSPVYLLSESEIKLESFNNLNFLSLRNVNLSDYSFLKELKGLNSLYLSSDHIKDVTFLKELDRLNLLYLESNQIIDVSFLKELEGLTSLYLRNTKIEDYSFLKELKGLNLLYLGSNKIKDVSILKGLNSLNSLSLRSNRLDDCSFIKDLKGLTSLDLSNNNLTDVSFLRELTELTTLYLNDNRIQDVSFLKKLTKLISLHLSDNQIQDATILKELKAISSLYLSNNQIQDFSFLKKFNKSLTALDLSFTYLEDYSFLKILKQLTSLDLRDNQIQDFSFLEELTELTSLFLSNNKIKDLSFLTKLSGLTSLDLSYTNFEDYSVISELPSLTSLDLSSNQLIDVSFLKEQKGLTSLYLRDNKLTDVSFLKEIKGLTSLNFSGNQLTNDSFFKEFKGNNFLNLRDNQHSNVSLFKEFKDLVLLDLRNNQITDISFLKDLKGLTIIKLDDNLLENPPMEIAGQGAEAINNYFRQQDEQGTDFLYEAKMLVLGEGGAGKTTMVRKLEDPDSALPEEEETTRGIEVKKIKFKYNLILNEQKEFCINVWDFGGQAIYKATHRFFLSERTFYVILADTRKEDTDFFYWLHVCELFGGESPVMLVINEKYERKRSFDFSQLRGRFDNLRSKIEVNFSTKRGLNDLKNNIEDYIKNLSIVRERLPAGWVSVRECIEKLEENYISFEKFKGIANDNGIKRLDDILLLNRHFHDLGIFLHFQDDDILIQTIFLKPYWVTNAVYKIIDDSLLNESNGFFRRKDVENILNKDEFNMMHGMILQIMKKFLLIYEIGNTQTYISPFHLSEDQLDSFHFKDFISIRYVYKEFMPKGIINQFTVLMHDKMDSQDSVWKNGVNLNWQNSRAEIIEYYGSKEIKIKVDGERKRDFMTLIIETVDKINHKYKKLEVDKYIPCICTKCCKSKSPHQYIYKTLLHYINNCESEIKCDISFEMVKVLELVDKVIDKQVLDKDERKPSESDLEIIADSGKYKRIAVLQKRLRDKEIELKKETKQKELLDKEANKNSARLVWVYITLAIIVFIAVYYLIQEFKWDIAKRIEYLISFILALITYILSFIFGFKLTPENIRKRRLKRYKDEIYTRNKFDFKEYIELEKEIDEIKEEIRKLE